MRVRPYLTTDAEPLSRLYARSIQAHAASDYSHEQCAAWARLAPSAERLEALMADGRRRFVAVEGETVVGFLDLEANGHIHFLYKAPEAGRGVAASLLQAAEGACAREGVSRLFAEASEPARRFLERHGFTTVQRRDLEVEGVAIHNYAVEKRLEGKDV